MSEQLRNLFQRFDKDGNGVLDQVKRGNRNNTGNRCWDSRWKCLISPLIQCQRIRASGEIEHFVSGEIRHISPLNVKKRNLLEIWNLISTASDPRSRYRNLNFRSETKKFYHHLFSELNSDHWKSCHRIFLSFLRFHTTYSLYVNQSISTFTPLFLCKFYRNSYCADIYSLGLTSKTNSERWKCYFSRFKLLKKTFVNLLFALWYFPLIFHFIKNQKSVKSL